MNFVQTVIGQKICSLAAAALGKYNRGTTQYSVEVDECTYQEVLAKELAKKARLAMVVYEENRPSCLVFEKE